MTNQDPHCRRGTDGEQVTWTSSMPMWITVPTREFGVNLPDLTRSELREADAELLAKSLAILEAHRDIETLIAQYIHPSSDRPLRTGPSVLDGDWVDFVEVGGDAGDAERDGAAERLAEALIGCGKSGERLPPLVTLRVLLPASPVARAVRSRARRGPRRPSQLSPFAGLLVDVPAPTRPRSSATRLRSMPRRLTTARRAGWRWRPLGTATLKEEGAG